MRIPCAFVVKFWINVKFLYPELKRKKQKKKEKRLSMLEFLVLKPIVWLNSLLMLVLRWALLIHLLVFITHTHTHIEIEREGLAS